MISNSYTSIQTLDIGRPLAPYGACSGSFGLAAMSLKHDPRVVGFVRASDQIVTSDNACDNLIYVWYKQSDVQRFLFSYDQLENKSEEQFTEKLVKRIKDEFVEEFV
jgi:hypothetical protein